MQLDTRDLRILEGFATQEGRLKRLMPIIFGVDVVMAVVLYFVLDQPLALWIALALVGMGAISVLVLPRVVDRGEGSAVSVLAGRDPRRTVWGTVLDDRGDDPYPWSLRLDENIGSHGYVHLGVDGADWRPAAGERYRIAGFGVDKAPFRGVVLVTGEDSHTRHWRYSVVVSAAPRYVHTSE